MGWCAVVLVLAGLLGPWHVRARRRASSQGAESAHSSGEGAWDKPYLARLASGRAAVGGYAEAHFRFEREEGITEELTFVPKRFNLFFHAAVSDRFRMASELEFEEGTEEILLELAILDFEVHPALTFRAGMLLTPLGKFNLAHDSPANRMTDRPLVSTQIIPDGSLGAWHGLLWGVLPFSPLASDL